MAEGSAVVAPDRLAKLVTRTLEEAAFLFCTPAGDPDEAPPFEGEVVEARLAWRGPNAAELRLAMGADLAAVLAANLLGVDEAPGRGEEAAGELLNMAAGSVVAEIFGAGDPPRLGLPRVARLSPAEHARAASEAEVAVTLVEEEGRRIEVRVAREGRAP